MPSNSFNRPLSSPNFRKNKSRKRVLGKTSAHMLAIGLLLSTPTLAATETYYKWRNDAGTWSYGVIPPHGVEAIEVTASGGTVKKAPANVTTKKADSEANTDANQNNGGETTEYIVEERNMPSKAEQKRLCKAAKTNLEALESSAVIRLRNQDGEVKALSDSDRQAEIDNAKKTIKDFC